MDSDWWSGRNASAAAKPAAFRKIKWWSRGAELRSRLPDIRFQDSPEGGAAIIVRRTLPRMARRAACRAGGVTTSHVGFPHAHANAAATDANRRTCCKPREYCISSEYAKNHNSRSRVDRSQKSPIGVRHPSSLRRLYRGAWAGDEVPRQQQAAAVSGKPTLS